MEVGQIFFLGQKSEFPRSGTGDVKGGARSEADVCSLLTSGTDFRHALVGQITAVSGTPNFDERFTVLVGLFCNE